MFVAGEPAQTMPFVRRYYSIEPPGQRESNPLTKRVALFEKRSQPDRSLKEEFLFVAFCFTTNTFWNIPLHSLRFVFREATLFRASLQAQRVRFLEDFVLQKGIIKAQVLSTFLEPPKENSGTCRQTAETQLCLVGIT
jgi:hypothetical protein